MKIIIASFLVLMFTGGESLWANPGRRFGKASGSASKIVEMAHKFPFYKQRVWARNITVINKREFRMMDAEVKYTGANEAGEAYIEIRLAEGSLLNYRVREVVMGEEAGAVHVRYTGELYGEPLLVDVIPAPRVQLTRSRYELRETVDIKFEGLITKAWRSKFKGYFKRENLIGAKLELQFSEVAVREVFSGQSHRVIFNPGGSAELPGTIEIFGRSPRVPLRKFRIDSAEFTGADSLTVKISGSNKLGERLEAVVEVYGQRVEVVHKLQVIDDQGYIQAFKGLN